MPMKRIGSPSRRAIAITIAAFAVPSSLVSTSPVTPTASWNWMAGIARSDPGWHRGRGESHAELTVHALDDAFDLFEFLHQVRLAVQAARRVGQQNVRASGFGRLKRIEHDCSRIGAGACWAANSDPVRWAQICNCSIAAARKVSPAASMTLRPSSASRRASLPMLVVLPEPLTPTTRITNGE